MSPKRQNQIDRALAILDKTGSADLLIQSDLILFIFKKTERIIAALYIITDTFPQEEPLKWQLRTTGAYLLNEFMSFKKRNEVHYKDALHAMSEPLSLLLSFFDLAHVADLISPMNFGVMRKEISILTHLLENAERIGEPVTVRSALPDDFFGISKRLFRSSRDMKEQTAEEASSRKQVRPAQDFGELLHTQSPVKDTHKGHTGIRDSMSFMRNAKNSSKSHREENTLKDKEKSQNVASTESKISYENSEESRKNKIIEILKDRHSATIKDFSLVIYDCSEKTIQRLLGRMVETGVLKREGERRWSVYKIAEKN
jgi:hypothetical protein